MNMKDIEVGEVYTVRFNKVVVLAKGSTKIFVREVEPTGLGEYAVGPKFLNKILPPKKKLYLYKYLYNKRWMLGSIFYESDNEFKKYGPRILKFIRDDSSMIEVDDE